MSAFRPLASVKLTIVWGLCRIVLLLLNLLVSKLKEVSGLFNLGLLIGGAG
jgi:hypothetical protein